MNILTITAGLVLAVSLTACGGNDSSAEPSPVETVTVSPSPTPEPINDDAFYADFVRDTIPELSSVDDETIIKNAEAICDGFQAGLDFEGVFMAANQSGLADKTVAELIGGAIAYDCPDYLYVLN